LRLLFLVPELRHGALGKLRELRARLLSRDPRAQALGTQTVFGGILNLLRHCAVARSLGAEALVATESGTNPYDEHNAVGGLPAIAWRARRPGDLCVLPDVLTWLAAEVAGPVVAYMQHPQQIHGDFDYRRPHTYLWTDSPPMLARCRALFPGTTVSLVPNVVDPECFPFVPQQEREPGELVAFPRKGATFIDDTLERYRGLGGSYWRLVRLHGLPFGRFAARMRRPQAFLASADEEGCALPPQECMAAGVLVVGKDAGGANYCMRDGETALVAGTPEAAAQALRRAEDAALRERLTTAAHASIRELFPDQAPARFWRAFLTGLE
jgi:Glycosyl transferases group 1